MLTNSVAVIPPPPVDCTVDVIFAIDESGSMCASNFAKVKSFLRQLVSRFDVDRCKTRVGLVTFSSNVGTVINLSNYSSVSSLQSAISSLSCRGEGSADIANALAYVRTKMLTSAAGDRTDIPNIVVVITDGNSDDFNATVVCIKFIACCLLHAKPKYLVKPHYANTRCS